MANRLQQVFRSEEAGKQLVFAVSKFALKLYKEQVKLTHGNIFMSPFSIAAVLNMALLGARGRTREEMKATLCSEHLENTKLHQAFSDILIHTNKCSREIPSFSNVPLYSLFMANRLYAEKSYKILDEYQTACKKHYDAELKSVNFAKEAGKAVTEINSWVSECTKEKITEIIAPGSSNSATRFVLVNAIYFKSQWQKQFEKHNTIDGDFFVTPHETITTKMMYQKLNYASYCSSKSLACEVIKLPYLGNRLSMFVLLPDKSSSLETLADTLTADHLENIDTWFHQIPSVNLWLPKFRIEETLNLKQVLQTMGMNALFIPGSSDLSGIDGTKELYASDVIHKAFVDVNEEGTEAAAATAMAMASSSLQRIPNTIDLRVDRPFLFFIREEATSAILFMGRTSRP